MEKKLFGVLCLIVASMLLSLLSGSGIAADNDDDGYNNINDFYPNDSSKWTRYWARAHNDNHNSGKTDEFGPTTLNIKWELNLGANVQGSPVIVDGLVYVGCYEASTQHNYLKCLNAVTGADVWSFTVPSGSVSCSPAVHLGKIYFGTNWGDGKFRCLDAGTGAAIWTATIGDVYTASPLVHNDTVFVGIVYGGVVALSTSDGSVLWETSSVGYMHSSPAYDNGVLYVCGDALNATTGNIIWSSFYNLDSSPVVQYGRVYGQTDDGYVVCLEASTGSSIWVKDLYDYGDNWNAITSTPCVANYRVYAGIQLGDIFCFDAFNGTTLWTKQMSSDVIASPIASGNSLVYFITEAANCINPETGEILWEDYLYGWSSTSTPTIYGGLLYSCWSGGIVCYGGADSSEDSDGDGVYNHVDAFPNNPTQWEDSDGDWHGDNAAGEEADEFPQDASQWSDLDGDGYGENPLGSEFDEFPDDPTEWNDVDDDGIGDNSDHDSDNDGVNDDIDDFPEEPTQWEDTDGDGYGDSQTGRQPDHMPNVWGNSTLDYYGCPDEDGDGWSSITDDLPQDPTQWFDTDSDGYGNDPEGNNPDAFPNDPTQWMDSDGDGYGDNVDGNNPDIFPQDRTEWKDTDGDGIGDFDDEDADNDGMPDYWEDSYGFDYIDSGDADSDYDHDGYSNLREYEYGTNPINSESVPKIILSETGIMVLAIVGIISGTLVMVILVLQFKAMKRN